MVGQAGQGNARQDIASHGEQGMGGHGKQVRAGNGKALAIQGKARQFMTGQGNAGRGRARQFVQVVARQDMVGQAGQAGRQVKVRQYKAR
jgi:hypothetical protein